MSETFELESIRRLDIKSGETLVVTTPADVRPHELQRISEQLRQTLPDVRILVVNGNVDMQVLCPSNPASTVDD